MYRIQKLVDSVKKKLMFGVFIAVVTKSYLKLTASFVDQINVGLPDY